jgi:hypothetical protein
MIEGTVNLSSFELGVNSSVPSMRTTGMAQTALMPFGLGRPFCDVKKANGCFSDGSGGPGWWWFVGVACTGARVGLPGELVIKGMLRIVGYRNDADSVGLLCLLDCSEGRCIYAIHIHFFHVLHIRFLLRPQQRRSLESTA